jgi:hypothetical protein
VKILDFGLAFGRSTVVASPFRGEPWGVVVDWRSLVER